LGAKLIKCWEMVRRNWFLHWKQICLNNIHIKIIPKYCIIKAYFFSHQQSAIFDILFMSCGFLAAKDFLIIWPSNILAVSAPDKYYSRNASCTLNLISTLLFIIRLDVVKVQYVQYWFYKRTNLIKCWEMVRRNWFLH
jgi:hypothetical protein